MKNPDAYESKKHTSWHKKILLALNDGFGEKIGRAHASIQTSLKRIQTLNVAQGQLDDI